MDEIMNAIKDAFPGVSWAYAVMYHEVTIGLWNGDNFVFHDSVDFDWKHVMELRVFNKARELRFLRDEGGDVLTRDSSEDIDANDEDIETRVATYRMYGTNDEGTSTISDASDRWIALREDRGGDLYFPKTPSFKGDSVMWLCIRSYLKVSSDLRLEIIDYAYTGFKCGLDKEEVVI